MNRTQFTFYESFYKALSRIRKATDRAKAYDLMVRFALYGEEPDLDALPDSIAIALELIRPNLEASRRKAEAGRLGGSKPEAKSKQTEAERKQEQDKDREQVREEDKVKEKEKEKVRDQDRGRDREQARAREKESPLPSYYPERVREEPADALLMETWNRQRRSWGLGS